MAFCSSFTRATKLNAPPIPRRALLPTPIVAPAHVVIKNAVRVQQPSPGKPRHRRMSLQSVPRLRKTVVTRAQDKGSTPDVDAIVKDLTDKWEKVDNKSSIALYGVGVIAVLYVTSSIVGAVNAIPLLPKFLELVGFIYTAWFVYRYLLFKSSREELTKDVDELKSKITGQQQSSGM